MITYCTSSGPTPAFARAPRIAIAPRSEPDKSFNEPIKRPIGVRAPATITELVVSGMGCPYLIGCSQLMWAKGEGDQLAPGDCAELTNQRMPLRAGHLSP